MTVREIVRRGSLSDLQWENVQGLARALAPEQAQWISGYFAGLADAGSGLAGDALQLAAPATKTRTLSILHAGETGNCARLAEALADASRSAKLEPNLQELAKYKVRSLREEQDVLFIVSTHGEGDPPQPALNFFEFIESARGPRVESLRYSVLALGDSTYEHYCAAGRRLDLRLEELGATRLQPRVDCDVDYDEVAAAWSEAVIKALADDNEPQAIASPTVFPFKAAHHDKRNPFGATLLENILLAGRNSTKATRHLEFSLSGSGLNYEPGDAVGIVTRNQRQIADELLTALDYARDTLVSIKGEELPFLEAMEERFEIARATPRFLDLWAELTASSELAALRGEDNGAARTAFLHDNHVIDIIRRFPARGIEPQAFVSGLRRLQPRLYSIASSAAACPDEVHLILAPVAYTLHDSARKGVASAHLELAQAAETVPLYIQPNPHFRLPGDDVKLIMIGAGTGIAPYRAFMQEREVRGACGQSWLFFGERNLRSDFLYQAEWQELQSRGILSRFDVAFSRDTDRKVYVQHRLMERAAELWAWLEEGAHLYVCGDATAMAPDVHQALLTIVEQQGARGKEEAAEYLRVLQSNQRYQRDVY